MSLPKRLVGRRFYARNRERLAAERNSSEAIAKRSAYYKAWWVANGEEVRERRRQKAARQRAARPRTSV